MARKRKWVRTTPTPREVARFVSLKLKICSGCHKIRFASYFRKDGYCDRCNEDEVTAAQFKEDQKFLKWFRRSFQNKED